MKYDVETYESNMEGVNNMAVAGAIKTLIENAAVGKGEAKYLGLGEVYFVPSDSTLGEFYIVVKIERKGWGCNCRGFRFSAREDGACKHVDIAAKIRKERRKQLNGIKRRNTSRVHST